MNRQPGKALPYLLRLRRPHVFDLIRENNLFTAIQDQALLLVEFDHELMEKAKKGQCDQFLQPQRFSPEKEAFPVLSVRVSHIQRVRLSLAS